MTYFYRLCFCILSTLFLNSAFALEVVDELAIKKSIQNIADSWNERECVGFADDFTDDADFVNIFGMHFIGKAEIEARHIKILQTFLKDSKFEVIRFQLRESKPGTVIALVHWKVNGFRKPNYDRSIPGTTQEGIFTLVFIQAENKWVITSAQNTLRTF